MRKFFEKLGILSLLIGAIFVAGGCSAMKQGALARVTPQTQNARVGSVYLLRGWIGIFSTGIDKLGEKINATGVHAEVFQEAQWATLADTIIKAYDGKFQTEPIVIIGHSYGADDAIAISRKLAEHKIKVDLVVTLDPVTPGKVPSNVELAYNLYQSNGALDALPWLRGIPLTPETPGPAKLQNLNIRTDRTDLLDPSLDHFNIEKKDKIHADVIAQVLKVCEPRAAWAARFAPVPTVVASAGESKAAPAKGEGPVATIGAAAGDKSEAAQTAGMRISSDIAAAKQPTAPAGQATVKTVGYHP